MCGCVAVVAWNSASSGPQAASLLLLYVISLQSNQTMVNNTQLHFFIESYYVGLSDIFVQLFFVGLMTYY